MKVRVVGKGEYSVGMFVADGFYKSSGYRNPSDALKAAADLAKHYDGVVWVLDPNDDIYGRVMAMEGRCA